MFQVRIINDGARERLIIIDLSILHEKYELTSPDKWLILGSRRRTELWLSEAFLYTCGNGGEFALNS